MKRDPWFPVALTLIVLLGVWLGIFGPIAEALDDGTFFDKLKGWQNLVAAFVAVGAAAVAVWNTTRTLRNSDKQESRRRERKRAAIRAGLPLALDEISQYAQGCMIALTTLYDRCRDDDHLEDVGEPPKFPVVPSNAIKTITELIEYSEETQTFLAEKLLARIQIQATRVRAVVEDISEPLALPITKMSLSDYIVDTAQIYAASEASYEFARKQAAELPAAITWDDVRHALDLFSHRDDEMIWGKTKRLEAANKPAL